MVTEQANVTEEKVEETFIEEVTTEPTSEAESDASTEEEQKPETTYTEDDIKTRIEIEQRKWQSSKDRELKPIYLELEQTKKTIRELDEKLDDKASGLLFVQESDESGDDKAQQVKESRDRVLKRYRELKHLEEVVVPFADELQKREKEVESKLFGLKYFPGGEEQISKVRDDFIKELVESDTHNPRDLELLARARSSELKSQKKDVGIKPDSGKQTKGAPKLTGDDALAYGLSKQK